MPIEHTSSGTWDTSTPRKDTSIQGFEYSFPAVRGIQAGREFYVVMCPLGLVSRVFVPDEGCVEPSDRGQRVLNKARLPKLARYLVDNPNDYSFAAITACVNGEVSFQPLSDEANWEFGRLVISMSAKLMITDGQHRWKAIAEAVEMHPQLEGESIPIVLFADEGVERRQQMFTDLNMHSVRPTRSLGILYDHRDEVAHLARFISTEVPVFAGRTEVEKTTISNRSRNIFTLSAIYQATAALLGKKSGDVVSVHERDTAHRFWRILSDLLPGWTDVLSGELKPWELRAEYVHGHGVVLQALGAMGRTLIEEASPWSEYLEKSEVGSIDWSRSNSLVWEGRALSNGRVSKAQKNVALTTSFIKGQLQLPLTAKEKELEAELSAAREAMGWEAA